MQNFYSKSLFREDNEANLPNGQFNAQKAVTVTFDSGVPWIKKEFLLLEHRTVTLRRLDLTGNKVYHPRHKIQPGSTLLVQLQWINVLIKNYRKTAFDPHTAEYALKGSKTGNQIHGEFIEKINNILSNILDVRISGLGNPMEGKRSTLF